MSPYQILGLKDFAPTGEVKVAYRRLTRKYHPDISKALDAEDRMKEINNAFQMIMKGWQPPILSPRVVYTKYYYQNAGTTAATGTPGFYV